MAPVSPCPPLPPSAIGPARVGGMAAWGGNGPFRRRSLRLASPPAAAPGLQWEEEGRSPTLLASRRHSGGTRHRRGGRSERSERRTPVRGLTRGGRRPPSLAAPAPARRPRRPPSSPSRRSSAEPSSPNRAEPGSNSAAPNSTPRRRGSPPALGGGPGSNPTQDPLRSGHVRRTPAA